MVCGEVLRDGHLPPVPVGQELLLVVQEFLVSFGSELVVGALDDGVHGARFLLAGFQRRQGGGGGAGVVMFDRQSGVSGYEKGYVAV